MTRIVTLFAAAALMASPAFAGSYSAKPATAPQSAKIIGKDISWTRDGDSYRGATEASRPLVICQDLAKRAGRIESFVADGRALSADQLAKCNASAKDGAETELAKAN